MKNILSTLHRHSGHPKPRSLGGWFLVTIVVALCPAISHAQDYSDFFSYNSSFELGSSAPPLVFPNNNSSVTTITGWTLSAGGQYPSWLEDADAQDGNRYIMLRSNGGAGAGSSGASIDGYSISPTPFTIGELYELSFWAAGGPAANNLVRVSLATTVNLIREDIALPTYTQAEFDALTGLEWSRYTIPFTATDTTMHLSISSPSSTQGGYQSIVYLDNFSITQVPEPSSALLAAAGGLVLLTRRRRRGCAGSLPMRQQYVHA